MASDIVRWQVPSFLPLCKVCRASLSHYRNLYITGVPSDLLITDKRANCDQVHNLLGWLSDVA